MQSWTKFWRNYSDTFCRSLNTFWNIEKAVSSFSTSTFFPSTKCQNCTSFNAFNNVLLDNVDYLTWSMQAKTPGGIKSQPRQMSWESQSIPFLQMALFYGTFKKLEKRGLRTLCNVAVVSICCITCLEELPVRYLSLSFSPPETDLFIFLHGSTVVLTECRHPIVVQRQTRSNGLYQIRRRLSIVLYVLHECH